MGFGGTSSEDDEVAGVYVPYYLETGEGGTLVPASGSTAIGLVKTDMSELPDYAPPAEQFEGTYYFVSITTTDGNTVEAGDEINDMPVTDEYYVLQINADGTFTFTYNPLDGSDGMPMEGTWEVTDGTIDMTAELGTMSGQLSGSALTLTANDGTVLEFTRNRGGSPEPGDPGGEAHDRRLAHAHGLAEAARGHEGGLIIIFHNILGNQPLPLGEAGVFPGNKRQNVLIHVQAPIYMKPQARRNGN